MIKDEIFNLRLNFKVFENKLFLLCFENILYQTNNLVSLKKILSILIDELKMLKAFYLLSKHGLKVYFKLGWLFFMYAKTKKKKTIAN